MSTPVEVEPVMDSSSSGLGRCKCSFWFAVAHDILGVILIMVGVFGGLIIHDLFVYAGAIIIFLSLIWWVFWYSGNIDVPSEELEDDVGLLKLKNRGPPPLTEVVRSMSRRLSNRIRDSFKRSNRSTREDPTRSNRPSNTEDSLSAVYNATVASSSIELVKETWN